jgi:type I restriction enzyme M protein
MPSGVFKPYAGVSTAIMIFTKTNSGGTDNVWFYDMTADGFSLDDKRNPIAANDIPNIIAQWNTINESVPELVEGDRTAKSFLVPFSEIRTNDWDLSINRYKETVHEEVAYDSPAVILADIKQLDAERAKALKKLEELLG